MKVDIDFPEVEQIGICAIPEETGEQTMWKVHIINLLGETIKNVLVAAKGYGMSESELVNTSELRHYFDEIAPKSERPIELIPDDLTGLNNQYWVSFYIGEKIYDKKFIFLPDTLIDSNLTRVPVLEKSGVFIL
jgi:hypothetical protein